MKLLTAFLLTTLALCLAVAGESDSKTGADTKTRNERVERLFASMRDGTYKGDLTFPELKWEDIPALLERGKSTTRLKSFPSNWLSSYVQDGAEEGTVALWLIDGLRRGGKWPSLNPLCLGREKPGEKMEETSRRNLPTARKAFEVWWQKVEKLKPQEAAEIRPLDGTTLRWYGEAPR